MDDPDLHALAAQVGGDPVGAALGADEDEAPVGAADDGGGHVDLVHLVDPEEPVLHQVDRRLVRLDLVVHRVDQVLLHDVVDVAVEGGGEQHRLGMGVAQMAENPGDLGREPHVGHAVGLVEHDQVDLVEIDLLPLEEVDHPAGGGDDDVALAAEGGGLLAGGVAPVDGDDREAPHGRQRRQHAGHLHGELPGGDEDEGPGVAGCRRLGRLDGGDAEGQGFARAGLGLAADVAPGQCGGKGERLDRERLGDALSCEGVAKVGRHPKGVEPGVV